MPALREAYPELDGRKGVELFRRKWICTSSFAANVADECQTTSSTVQRDSRCVRWVTTS